MTAPLKERHIETYLHEWVRSLGGSHRRVKWIGRKNAPDDLCMLPGEHFFVECKRPGEEPTPAQAREHTRMRAAGMRVEVFNSLEGIDKAMKQYLKRSR